MADNKDYTKKSFVLTLAVIAVLTGLSFVPPFSVGGVDIKRANILSDILDFDDVTLSPLTSEDLLDTSFLELFNDEADSLFFRRDTLDSLSAEPLVDTLGSSASEPQYVGAPARRFSKPVIVDDSIVCIEDFSRDGVMMDRFYHYLAHSTTRRPLRIAVLGDSFIEADIITADLREQLQVTYGGNGVGFVPFSTPLSKYRGTVKHTHDGWTNYNIVKHKEVPEEYKKWFAISGLLSIPKDGALSEYRGVDFRQCLRHSNTASLLFVNRENSTLSVTVNDTLRSRHNPPPATQLERIVISSNDISKLDVKIGNAKGFIGLGVILEDRAGVSVHNFSVRSNSGMALLATDQDMNRQLDTMMNYDLIILQYGLNAMGTNVTDYKYYGRQLEKVIDYVKKCFPQSAIVVMSIGDRSTLKGGTATTMPAVAAMIKTQRQSAENCGVGFWNTYEAMGGENSMPRFVEKKWAGKDHTHIRYEGGKYIATQLVKFLNAAVESVRQQDGPAWTPVLNISGHGAGETYMLNSHPVTLPWGAAVPSPENTPLQGRRNIPHKPKADRDQHREFKQLWDELFRKTMPREEREPSVPPAPDTDIHSVPESGVIILPGVDTKGVDTEGVDKNGIETTPPGSIIVPGAVVRDSISVKPEGR